MLRITRSFLIILLLGLSACTVGQPPRGIPGLTATAVTPAAKAAQTISPAAVTTGAVTASPASTAAASAAPTFVPTNPGAPDVASYNIAVTLDPAAHHLSGKETITYTNTAQKPIPDLEFHLYLNAFKSPDTIFMKESGGQLRGDQFNPQNNGWIMVNSLAIQNGPTLTLEQQEDGTLARAVLPQPVQPGQSIHLEVAWEAQLPQVFARTGWALDAAQQPFFLVGQWFPKLGVWTEKGWNAYPFHGNAEFFADFGNYDVAITLPATYHTGATGLLTGTTPAKNGNITVSYGARGVIDFAFVASPNLKSASRKVGNVEILYLYLPEHEWSVSQSLNAAADAVKYFGDWYGAYPYARLTVVDVPEEGQGAGGMEYPTFVTAGAITRRDQKTPDGWTNTLAITIIHEIGHQWFQSMVATNEDEEPWLDEGFADYSTVRLMIAKYGLNQSNMNVGSFQQGFLEGRHRYYLRAPTTPMEGKAWDYKTWDAYVVAAYAKPDMALMTLDNELTEPVMTKVLRTYAETYRFAHPTAADFQKVATQVSGQSLDWFFSGLVYHGQTLNYVAKSINEPANGKAGSITVAREGDLIIPTEILVTYTDSSTQTIAWDGQNLQHIFVVAKTIPIQSIDIDPTHKLIIDLDWTDNKLEKP